MERYDDPERPRNYVYRSINKGLADEYLLKHWWPIAIRTIPRTMPANAVTLLGNVFFWLCFSIMAGFPFGPLSVFSKSKPWIFGILALFVFIYQTLDALDGLQARRTGASGPLGEFLDHYLDSIIAFLIPVGLAMVFPDAPPILVFTSIVLGSIAEWINIRSTYNTGVLVFGKASTEEGLLLLIGFLLSVWFLGYDFWAGATPLMGFAPINLIFLLLIVIYIVGSLMALKEADRFDWLGLSIAQLLPLFAWALAVADRLGASGLLLGGLVLGFAGVRFSGNILRARVVGVAYTAAYPDLVAMGALLLTSAFLPGLPPWVLPFAGFAALAWSIFVAWGQFARTLARVREILGMGLFGKSDG